MKQLKYYFLICCLVIATVVNAQGITSVSGTISDSFGPVVGAAIVEMDASNRNISATVTDFNGNFTLKIKNPKNRLKISYVGMKTQILPINKKVKFTANISIRIPVEIIIPATKNKLLALNLLLK